MPDVNELGSVPASGTPNNVPAHIQALKDAINTGSLVRRLSQAQIDALAGDQRPIGLLVYNLTKQKLGMWDGSAWLNVSGVTIADDGSLTVPKVKIGNLSINNDSAPICELKAPGANIRLQAGSTTLSVVYNGAVTLNRSTQSGDAGGAVVTKDYVDGGFAPADVLSSSRVRWASHVATADASGYASVTFASAFASAPRLVLASAASPAAAGCYVRDGVNAPTAAGFQVGGLVPSQQFRVNYLALA